MDEFQNYSSDSDEERSSLLTEDKLGARIHSESIFRKLRTKQLEQLKNMDNSGSFLKPDEI